MMHNESVGMEKKGERERDPPGAARGGWCVGMRERGGGYKCSDKAQWKRR